MLYTVYLSDNPEWAMMTQGFDSVTQPDINILASQLNKFKFNSIMKLDATLKLMLLSECTLGKLI